MPRSEKNSVAHTTTKNNPNASNQFTTRNINIDLESLPTASYVFLVVFDIQSHLANFSS